MPHCRVARRPGSDASAAEVSVSVASVPIAPCSDAPSADVAALEDVPFLGAAASESTDEHSASSVATEDTMADRLAVGDMGTCSEHSCLGAADVDDRVHASIDSEMRAQESLVAGAPDAGDQTVADQQTASARDVQSTA